MPDRRMLAAALLAAAAAVLAFNSGPATGPPLAAILWLPPADEPELHAGIVDHFKYGSIGAESRAGVPYYIWAVLPNVFPEYLPKRPGEGYARFGLIFEGPASKRPIGTSLRNSQVELVGLNCAVCHTGTLRDAPGAPVRIIPGMPSHQFDLQSYQRFLFSCFGDSRFNSDRIMSAIRQKFPELSWFTRTFYSWIVIPRTQKEAAAVKASFAYFDSRPPSGPGRVDTFSSYKVMFGLDMQRDTSVGTADLPSLWNQRVREGLWLHWDGNNNLVTERNKSAAIGAGASEDSLDLESMKRVEDWILDLKPPPFPSERIDSKRALAGRLLFEQHCAECHALNGKRVGQTVPIDEIGTDPERLNSFTKELADKMNTLGTGKPWRFSHFRKTNGYSSMPLDGVWLRAPYLHNGSVPTLRDLLKPAGERPAVFRRGYDVYDYEAAGFVSSGPEAEREGFRFDTSVRGNGRQGHEYGTRLTPAEKLNLIEYLKTL
ncbi:MAG: cytochrome c [Candidatus Solibacter sp.]